MWNGEAFLKGVREPDAYDAYEHRAYGKIKALSPKRG